MAEDTKATERRLELLALARQQRHAWLAEALESQSPETSRFLREMSVIESATKEVFESASSVVRFLSRVVPEEDVGKALLPLEDDGVEGDLRAALRPAAQKHP